MKREVSYLQPVVSVRQIILQKGLNPILFFKVPIALSILSVSQTATSSSALLLDNKPIVFGNRTDNGGNAEPMHEASFQD